MKVFDDGLPARKARMIEANEPMRRLAEYYGKGKTLNMPSILGKALGVAWSSAQPFEMIEQPKTEELALAEALAWLDQDLRNRKRTEKVLRLMLRFGPEIVARKASDLIGRAWLERMLK